MFTGGRAEGTQAFGGPCVELIARIQRNATRLECWWPIAGNAKPLTECRGLHGNPVHVPEVAGRFGAAKVRRTIREGWVGVHRHLTEAPRKSQRRAVTVSATNLAHKMCCVCLRNYRYERPALLLLRSSHPTFHDVVCSLPVLHRPVVSLLNGLWRLSLPSPGRDDPRGILYGLAFAQQRSNFEC